MSDQSNKPLCCTWSHRGVLPPGLKDKFGDLDQFMRDVVGSANSRLLIVAPYISPGGLNLLRDSMLLAIRNGAWIRILTGDLESNNRLNRRAFEALFRGEQGQLLRDRSRILICTERLPVLFHAKIIIADAQRGYMGSANVSVNAMDNNFEIGCALNPAQAEHLDKLVDFLEAKGFISDCTATL